MSRCAVAQLQMYTAGKDVAAVTSWVTAGVSWCAYHVAQSSNSKFTPRRKTLSRQNVKIYTMADRTDSSAEGTKTDGLRQNCALDSQVFITLTWQSHGNMPMDAHRGSKNIVILMSFNGARWESASGTGRFNPGKDARYPLYRRLCVTHHRSVQA